MAHHYQSTDDNAQHPDGHDEELVDLHPSAQATDASGGPGFNGELTEAGTGWQLLGNGYRAYNPALMRFHSPDSLSPFGEGGLNGYAYCEGDPVNQVDPSGHGVFTGLLKTLRLVKTTRSAEALKIPGLLTKISGTKSVSHLKKLNATDIGNIGYLKADTSLLNVLEKSYEENVINSFKHGLTPALERQGFLQDQLIEDIKSLGSTMDYASANIGKRRITSYSRELITQLADRVRSGRVPAVAGR